MEEYIKDEIKNNLIPNLMEFIKIPNVSRVFDDNWKTNGLMNKAVNFCKEWAKKQNVEGLELIADQEEGKTSLLFGKLKGNSDKSRSLFLYGHIDKQPPLTECWSEGLGPYTPVIKNGKLYGRGSSDDGYAFFLSVILLKALQKFKLNYGDVILFFETDEESDSIDIHHYLDKYKTQIGEPDLMICLDSGTDSYDSFSLTTTLRGVMEANIKIQNIKEGVHSGDGSGVIPDNFRIMRDLLDCFEDVKTGRMNDMFRVIVPKDKYSQALDFSKNLVGFEKENYPFLDNVQPTTNNTFLNYMNRIWEPQMTVTGVKGLPETSCAGNVVNPFFEITISIRLPPTLNEEQSKEALKKTMELYNNRYNAKIDYKIIGLGEGWSSVPFKNDLMEKLEKVNKKVFNSDISLVGQGGSIPFVNELQKKFTKSEIMVTGVLGPGNNAHGPDENLDINYLEKFSVLMGLLLQENI